MSKQEKLRKLKALALKRKRTRWVGYKCIGDYFKGRYECGFVSPYTKTAGNVDSDIMVMLQDWTSDEKLRQAGFDPEVQMYGRYRELKTNRNLEDLLKDHFGRSIRDIYATNLFPFIKRGGMSAKIKWQDLVRAAKEFGIPQIETVNPKIVICLGKQTYNAIRVAAGEDYLPTLASAIKSQFPLPKTKAVIWCQAHTGYWGPVGRNKKGNVANDWRRMRKSLSTTFQRQ